MPFPPIGIEKLRPKPPGGRMFPVLLTVVQLRKTNIPSQLPWRLVAPYEEQARRNHGQTLERLAQRGGLSPSEIHSIVHGLRRPKMASDDYDPVTWLIQFIEEDKKCRTDNNN